MENTITGVKLTEIVISAKPQLLSLSSSETESRPHPDKWSQKEILGHLIDSAANNHQRFVRGQAKEDMIFDGYDQVGWVKTQNYQERNWAEIIELWAAYNLHLAFVMESMPLALKLRAVSKHNLHKIAFRTIPDDEETCLEYFMVDYVAHVEHHLKQILAGYAAKLGPYENTFHKKG